MIIKGLADEVFGDYRKPAMQIVFPRCSFKCDIENGCKMCQNSALAQSNPISYPIPALVHRYITNPITKAVVCGGLEPMDSPKDLIEFITVLRSKSEDDVVIYTGYTEEEMEQKALEIENVQKFLEGLTIVKVVTIPGKLVSIVAK